MWNFIVKQIKGWLKIVVLKVQLQCALKREVGRILALEEVCLSSEKRSLFNTPMK